MDLTVRQRIRPAPAVEVSDEVREYGPFADKMTPMSKYYYDVRDRCAYVAITGQFPSHLRREYSEVLRTITHQAKNGNLAGSGGYRKVNFWPFKHLDIEHHPMYLAAATHVAKGYQIVPSRAYGSRRGYSQIFLTKTTDAAGFEHRITIKIDGAIKQGWY